ncbi:MAG: hypothetical protein IMZ57_04105 [Acidobacteria bacterium]|nr:hypothetical protein [Acidobacteriota bacterium]
MSYPKNAATPKPVLVGPVTLIADGSNVTTGAAVAVKLDANAAGAGGGTLAYDATLLGWTYAPLQAETNGDVLMITVSKASCLSATLTVIIDPGVIPAGWIGTGTGQISLASGVVAASVAGTVAANVTEIHGSALSETGAGYLAAAFTKFFDTGTPTWTVDAATPLPVNVTLWGGVAIEHEEGFSPDGVPVVNVKYIGDAQLDQTIPGGIAAAFTKFFDVETPVGTVNLIAASGNWNTVTPDAAGTLATALTVLKGATWDAGTDTLEAIRNRGDAAWITATGFATPTNITAGTITTVTNLTNAPVDSTGVTEILTRLPDAVPGAAGGVFIAGTNAATTITTAGGSALTLTSTGTNGSGLSVKGNGTGSGLLAIGGASGHGISATGGTTSGDGLLVRGDGNGNGIEAVGATDGVDIRGNILGNITGTLATVTALTGTVTLANGAHGGAAASMNLASGLTANITGNITGTLGTVTTLTNLPTIPANWITAAGIHTDAGAEIADAVWDEALAGHVGAGTAGKKLTDLTSGGSVTGTITITDGGDPVAGATCRISTDDAGTLVIWGPALTPSTGIITLTLDPGTYYLLAPQFGGHYVVPEVGVTYPREFTVSVAGGFVWA